MAIECIRDLIKLDQVIGSDVSQALVEGEIIVPESKAAVARILDVSGEVLVSSREVIQDRVMIEGIIRYDILYITEEGEELETLDSDIGFTHYIEVPGSKPQMNSNVKLQIEHMEHELISGRKVAVKSVLNIDGMVSQVLELDAVKNFDGLEDVEVLSDRIYGRYSAGTGGSQTIVRESIELPDNMPSILKIIHKNIKIGIKEKKAADNRVIVSGDLYVKLLYLCADELEPVQFLEDTLPFSHFVEIPDVYQGMDVEVKAGVADVYAEPRENINDEFRIVDLEAIIDLDAEAFEGVEGDILVDAYSPSVSLDIKRKKVEVEQVMGESRSQLVVKESLTLPESVPQARKILYAYANPVVTDERVEQDKVVIEGFLGIHLVYQTKDNDGIIASFNDDIPFKQLIEIEGINEDMSCSCCPVEEHISYTLIAADEVEFKVAIETTAVVSKKTVKEVIIGVEELEFDEKDDSGIYVYFVQKNDTLWSIAKRYNTTIAGILKTNNMDEGSEIKVGDKLIIYKKLNAKVV